MNHFDNLEEFDLTELNDKDKVELRGGGAMNAFWHYAERDVSALQAHQSTLMKIDTMYDNVFTGVMSLAGGLFSAGLKAGVANVAAKEVETVELKTTKSVLSNVAIASESASKTITKTTLDRLSFQLKMVGTTPEKFAAYHGYTIVDG